MTLEMIAERLQAIEREIVDSRKLTRRGRALLDELLRDIDQVVIARLVRQQR